MQLPEGERMGKREHPLVNYYENHLHFAELLNGWLFHGEERIHPEIISNMDRRLLKKTEKEKYRERYRDIYKNVLGIGIHLVIGMELQEYVHYTMPLRIMDYDVISYSNQKTRISDIHKERKDLQGDELLSGFAKKDKLQPVITLVLYFGKEKEWDGARSLHELLDFENVPDELKKYVEDYKIEILDICHTSDERLKEFPPDIRVLFLFLKNMDNRKELIKILEEEGNIRSDTYDVLVEYTGEEKLKDLKNKVKEGEQWNMCKAIREMVEEGEKRGYEQGIAAERVKTEYERARAERAEQRVRELEKKLEMV